MQRLPRLCSGDRAKRHQRGNRKDSKADGRWIRKTLARNRKRSCETLGERRRMDGSTVQEKSRGFVDGKRHAVTYEILTDPGSNIPGWLIDKVNRASVPDVLRAMRKRALSGESMHILPDREGEKSRRYSESKVSSPTLWIFRRRHITGCSAVGVCR